LVREIFSLQSPSLVKGPVEVDQDRLKMEAREIAKQQGIGKKTDNFGLCSEKSFSNACSSK